MRITFGLLLPLCFAITINAQEIVLSPAAEIPCKPGVINKSPSQGILVDYFVRPQSTLSSNSEQVGSNNGRVKVNDRFRFKLKAPIIHGDGFNFLVGLSHMREGYEFSSSSLGAASFLDYLNEKTLKTTRLSAYFLKPINSKFYASLKLEGSFNGDYDGFVDFSERYAVYRAGLMLGMKKDPYTEWGFGLMVSKGFRRSLVLPFLMYNRTFNQRWGLETVLPVKIQVRHNISPDKILLLGTQFNSRNYSIDLPQNNATGPSTNSIFHMRSAELQIGATYQQRLSKWAWASLQAGYAQNFTSRFDRVTPERELDYITARLSGGPFMKFGLFLSPPKTYYCKGKKKNLFD